MQYAPVRHKVEHLEGIVVPHPPRPELRKDVPVEEQPSASWILISPAACGTPHPLVLHLQAAWKAGDGESIRDYRRRRHQAIAAISSRRSRSSRFRSNLSGFQTPTARIRRHQQMRTFRRSWPLVLSYLPHMRMQPAIRWNSSVLSCPSFPLSSFFFLRASKFCPFRYFSIAGFVAHVWHVSTGALLQSLGHLGAEICKRNIYTIFLANFNHDELFDNVVCVHLAMLE